MTLVELLDDPGVDGYRFSVEVRDDTFAPKAWVGLYYAHQVVRNPVPVHMFGKLHFSDKDPETVVALQHCCMVSPENSEPPLAGPAVIVPGFPPGKQRAERWRALSVEVNNGKVLSTFDTLELRNWDLATIAKWAKRLPELFPPLKNAGPNIIPRGGLGLYVLNCKASFRNGRVVPVR